MNALLTETIMRHTTTSSIEIEPLLTRTMICSLTIWMMWRRAVKPLCGRNFPSTHAVVE